MECQDVQTYLADHLAHALPPDTADAVRTHLERCASCGAAYEEAHDTWQRLGVIAAPRADSAAMRARFQHALDEYVQAAAATAPRRAMALPAWAQVAAAAALLMVGVAIGRGTMPAAEPDPQIVEMREELRDMRELVTLSLLQQPSAAARLKGVSYSERLEQPGTAVIAALLDTLRYDSSANVRLSVIDALKPLAEYEDVRRGALDALPQQTSPHVQIALIDFVGEVNRREAAGVLRQIAEDPMTHTEVRTRAAQVLEQVG